MSEGHTPPESGDVLVTINEDIQQSIQYIRSNNAEALAIPAESFGSYVSGVSRDRTCYTVDWMKESSEASAKVWDLLDRMDKNPTTDGTMLSHIHTLKDVAENNRNDEIWSKDGCFDIDKIHGFTSPDFDDDELCDSSDDEEDAVIVVS